MPHQKKIKIYTYHGHYLKLPLAMQKTWLGRLIKIGEIFFNFLYATGLAVLKSANWLLKSSILLFYRLGELLINFVQRGRAFMEAEIKKTRLTLPHRLKLLNQKQFSYGLLTFIVVSMISWGALGGLRLIGRALALKVGILTAANLGNNYLSQAKDALSKQDFGQAQNRFALAYQTFTDGQKRVEDSEAVLNQILGLLPQKQAADSLLKAAALVSQAGQNFIGLQAEIKQLQIGPFGITSLNGSTSQSLSDISDEMNQALAELDAAEKLIAGVDQNSLPQSFGEKFADLKNKLGIAQSALGNFSQVFNLARGLLPGDKNILILFENNNELRAGGGFIGSYGALKMEDGQIKKIIVSSIYDLDGQLLNVIQPPKPILNVNTRWFLRDANWFADFPVTAKKISSFYEQEGGETPDVVVALTPNIILDLLKITGPIFLPKYNITLTSDDFVEQTQAITSISDNLPTNEPKQLLADLVPILLQKLSQAKASDWTLIIQALQNNLSNKQIVFYSRDGDLQNQLSSFHWTGELSDSDRDYLNIVSSNLNGTKTDLAIDQKINLTTTVADDGTITNDLEITRSNKLAANLKDVNNDSFIRIYVPLGSRLISNLGFDNKNLNYPEGANYKVDDDVYNWEKNSVTDNLSGTTIGQESGKTFFGNWLNVNGGGSRTVKLTYQLPFKLSSVDRYSLLLQKQIGSQDSSVNWTLNFAGRSVAWKNFDPGQLNTDNLNSAIILSKDYFFGMVLQKR